MILTLTLNPAIDVTYSLPSFEAGATNRVRDVHERAGGKGVNVSRVIHAQGGATEAVVVAGGASGARLVDDLVCAGIPHIVVPAVAPTRHTVAVVDAERVTLLAEPGAALDAGTRDAVVEVIAGRIAEVDCLVVSGSTTSEADDDVIRRLVAIARSSGTPVIVDTSGSALLAAADAGADVVKPNIDELRAATQEQHLVDGIAALHERGADIVVVSLGEEGLIAVARDGRAARGRASPILGGNPTGAGDAAVAAFAVGLAEGEADLAVLVRRAVAWSAAAVSAPRAGELDEDADLTGRAVTVSAVGGLK